jgi:hypothetical protein
LSAKGSDDKGEYNLSGTIEMQNLPWTGYKEENEVMELEKIDSLFISPVDGKMHGSGNDKFGSFSISG